jgi:hypothetical protein
MSNAILDSRGNFYYDVYYVPNSFELFEYHVKAELRLKGLPKVSPRRIKRLFDVYRFIVQSKRVVWENETSLDFKLYANGRYDNVSHHSILSDFHILESVSLLFRRGESLSDGRILQFRELAKTEK